MNSLRVDAGRNSSTDFRNILPSAGVLAPITIANAPGTTETLLLRRKTHYQIVLNRHYPVSDRRLSFF